MFDIILESLRALVLLAILIFFFRADKDIEYGRRGWLFVKLGFLLVLFGAFVDITDNFDSLNWVVIIGDTPIQAFLEKVVGYLGGFIMIAIGFWLWIPSMQQVHENQRILAKMQLDQQHDLTSCSNDLEKLKSLNHKMEQTQQQAEDELQMIFENAPIGITHGLIGQYVIERNMEFARMLGYDSPDELDSDVNKLSYWNNLNDLAALNEQLKTEQRIRDFQTQLIKKDGSTISVRFDFNTLADSDGNNFYFYGFVNDISKDDASG